MDILEFIASLADSLAWPIVAVVALLVLKEQIGRAIGELAKRMSKAKVGVAELEFEAAAREARRDAEASGEERPAPVSTPTPEVERLEALKEVAAISPRGAVLSAYIEIEQALRDLMGIDTTDPRHTMAGRQLMRMARDQGQLPEATYLRLLRLSEIRNQAVHLPQEPSPASALDVIESTRDALVEIKQAMTAEQNPKTSVADPRNGP